MAIRLTARFANAYSEDLRVRARTWIKSGISMSQVSRGLQISRPTLYRWKKQWEKTGSTAPVKSVPPAQPSKIKDWHRFEEFIERNGDQTQKELAQLWGGVSHHTISRALKKLGYTRKKRCDPAPASGARESAPRQTALLSREE